MCRQWHGEARRHVTYQFRRGEDGLPMIQRLDAKMAQEPGKSLGQSLPSTAGATTQEDNLAKSTYITPSQPCPLAKIQAC
jgi:hypothetical protein